MEEKTKKGKRIQQILIPLVILLLLVLTFFLLRLLKHQKKEYHGYYVFCLDANETKVKFEAYQPKNNKAEELIQEFLDKMQQEPSDISMKKAIPDNVSVDEFLLSDQGELSLYLDSSYGNYDGVTEILRRAAIVKTLCQIKAVDSVQFFVAGQPLTDSNSDAIGFMTADTFIDNTGGASYQQSATLNMYFSSTDGNALSVVPVEITYDATIPLEQMTIEQLIKGPYSIEGITEDQVLATIPKGTSLNSITVKEHTCYVDFSGEFLNKPDQVSPEVAIYSVVNTLTELPAVNKVQFSIDGEQVLLYNDTINFGEVFERNLDLVQE